MTDYATWLCDWFRARAPHAAPAPDGNYFAAGAIDSFGVIELIEAVESEFSVRFTQADFQDPRFASISGLAALLKEKAAP